MKKLSYLFFAVMAALVHAQTAQPIDLSHWDLELPTGYKASEWKLSQFESDEYAKPFFYKDDMDGALTMVAYPAEGTSSSKYTQNRLRERINPCLRDLNWSMQEGGVLKAEFQVSEMSWETDKKRHRTLLFQIHGTTSSQQEKDLGLEKSVSVPFFSVYWQNDRIRVVRKIIKEPGTDGYDLIDKKAWDNDPGRYFPKKIGFDKATIEIKVAEGKVEISLNGSKPFVYKDVNVRKWPFENYFIAGNYLQTKSPGSRSVVKFYSLEVTH